MGFIDRQIARLAGRAAARAVVHATAAEAVDNSLRAVALETAVQADDAAVLARFAARRSDHARLFQHLSDALDAAARARRLERLALRAAGTG